MRKQRNKTSIIWTMPDTEFQALVRRYTSLSDVLRELKFSITGRGQKMIKERCAKDSIDISHIRLGTDSNKGRKFRAPSVPLEEVMTEGSRYYTGHLKKRLLKSGILHNHCCLCGQGSTWNGKPLVMRLDHINGIKDDHRRENLRMVCPNCDSQLPTFSGRNR